jgi:hypothetical protein
MKYVIRAIAFANGAPCPHAGQWLAHFDVDALNGQGWGEFTDKILNAKKFNTFEQAMEFWGRQSKVQPWRPDGMPNKPLTALTAVIERFVVEDFVLTVTH